MGLGGVILVGPNIHWEREVLVLFMVVIVKLR